MTSASKATTASARHWLDRAEDWVRILTQPISFIGVVGMLIAAGVTVGDVLMRWLVSAAILGLNEIAGMVFAVAVAACIPAGVARGVNLKIDLLEHAFSPRAAVWLHAIGAMLLLLFLALLAWRIGDFGLTLAEQGRATVLRAWPIAPFIQVSATLLALAAATQVVIAANTLRRALAFDPKQSSPRDRTSRILDGCTIAFGLVVAVILAWSFVDFDSVSTFAQDNAKTSVGLALLAMWISLLCLIPLAAGIGLIGLFGCALIIGWAPAYSAMATELFGFMSNYQIAVLPLFLMMGSFAAASGIADDAYALAHACLGRFRGGLAMATIGGCAGLGAVTGSSVATAAAIGRVALPEMRARGYSDTLSSGSIAAGGTLGNFVPPGSGPLVLFALMTEASIGQLFIGSVIPALLVTLAYLLTVSIFVRMHPDAAPVAVPAKPGELTSALRRCGPLFVLFVGILGGMYAGIFSATEAAAVGAFGAFLTAVWRGKIRPANFWAVMSETTQVTAMIYTLIFGALVFAFFCDITAVAEQLTRAVRDLGWPPLLLIGLLLMVFIVLGTFMDSYTVMIVTIPIVTPLILASGYDLVWWGIINLFVVEIGAISPPFGLNMFVLKSIGDVDLTAIFYGSAWFCGAAILTLVLLVIFPQVSLWLPATMYN